MDCEAGTYVKKAARKNLHGCQNVMLGEDAMVKPLFVALLCATAIGITVVQAQTGTGQVPRHKATRLLNENYLAATGETVAHPGASQGAATTDLDRRIRRRNDRIDQSICSNCD
jgi:hypothetical protein